MFWEIFVKLCNSINKSPNAVCKELGFSSATATFWKRGSQPRDSAVQKVAEYFKVPTEYLMGTDSIDINTSELEKKELSEQALKVAELFDKLNPNNRELALELLSAIERQQNK